MTYPEASDPETQNLLDAITEALLAQRDDFGPIMDQYSGTGTQMDELIRIIVQLRSVFVRQQPSDEFVKRLQRELVGHKPGLFDRWRYLPGRVQVAAGVAAVVAGGLMIVSRRRGFDLQETEIPVLQQN